MEKITLSNQSNGFSLYPKSIYGAIGVSAIVTSLLLSVPAIAMRLGDLVQWSVLDFVFAGGSIFTAQLALFGFIRKSKRREVRRASVLSVLGVVLLLWVNGAVGLIGNESNDFNALFLLIPLFLFVGFVVNRGALSKMWKLLLTVAIYHAALTLVGLILYQQDYPDHPITGTVIGNIGFVCIWALAAHFFAEVPQVDGAIGDSESD